MRSTMQDYQLTITSIFEHGRRVYGDSQVVTAEAAGARRASFREVAENAERLAAALARLGIRPGDRVGTLMWNSQEHLEAYFAVSCMGAVLHTANVRLFPPQLAWTIDHAEDRILIVDDTLVPVLARVRAQLRTVKRVIVVGAGDASALGDVLRYGELLAAERPGFRWPALAEDDAAAMCYSTGTTGDPKGVVYSHRSVYLHAFAVTSGAVLGLSERDRILPVVPMFHVTAWGLPYAGWLVGADLVMPGRYLQAEPLARLFASERPTFAAGVPTVWNDLLRYGEDHPLDLSSVREMIVGGSAVPRAMIERFRDRYGIPVLQGWGMTETSPVGAVAHPPRGTPAADEAAWRAKTGRVVPGIELRIVGDAGAELPWDGQAVGEIEVRGPWVTASYYRADAPERFHDGWLRTGDVGAVDPRGYVQITDRAKDVIKSGGEWISGMDLENTLMGHPAVAEAAVIGIPDERWGERPLACVVLRPGASASPDELRAFLAERAAKWWVPERWAFVTEIPKTSVGKFDKKVLRARHAEGALAVVTAGEARVPA